MFNYYFMLGLRSLRRNPALTALMVLTLAIGVAASVSTLTILHVMSGDPIPSKSTRLFVPLLDNGDVKGYIPGVEPGDTQMTYKDAVNLLAGKGGDRRTAVFSMRAPIEPARTDLQAMQTLGVATTHDFFGMFEVPFLYGQAWGAAEDGNGGADVVVLSRSMAEKLFGKTNPVGQRMRLMNLDYQIVGVLDTWRPVPRFFHLDGANGAFGDSDDFLIPFASAIRHEGKFTGSMSCKSEVDGGPGFQGLLKGECTWMQFWFETSNAAGRAALHDYLDGYTAEQGRLGRFPRHAANRLFDVMEWMEYKKVVGADNRLAAWLSLGFLALCLVNAIGLMLAKFSVRAAEVGIRRALGASRREIFSQFLIETAVVGLAGAVLGMLFAFGALALIGMQSKATAAAAHMDLSMLLLTVLMAVGAAVLAGLLPTWRACQVTPAMQLKSQ
jgi:putative ABC transport system permease protein